MVNSIYVLVFSLYCYDLRRICHVYRILPLKKAAEEKAQAIRAATVSSFKSMLREKEDITVSSRWSRVGIFTLGFVIFDVLDILFDKTFLLSLYFIVYFCILKCHGYNISWWAISKINEKKQNSGWGETCKFCGHGLNYCRLLWLSIAFFFQDRYVLVCWPPCLSIVLNIFSLKEFDCKDWKSISDMW